MKKVIIKLIMGCLLLVANAWALPTPIKTMVIKNETANRLIDISYPQGFIRQSINRSVLDLVTVTRNAFEKAVAEQTAMPAEIPGKNSLFIDHKIKFRTPQLLSLQFNTLTSFRGTAHPNNTVQTLNFIAGKKLTLNEILLENNNSLQKVADFCRMSLLKKANFDKDWVNKGTTAIADNYKNWLFDPQGLIILFDTYQVAPYVYGQQTVLIPQSIIRQWLRPNIVNKLWGN